VEINKFEEEMNADYRKTVTAVSRGRFRRADLTSWDKSKRKIARNKSEARGKPKISFKNYRKTKT
jgi:hypothetical protein